MQSKSPKSLRATIFGNFSTSRPTSLICRDLRKYLLFRERSTMILHKLLEGGRRTTEQAGNCIRDGRYCSGGKIGQQLTHRVDVPIGRSRFAHSVRCRRDRYVDVLNFPAEHGRQFFGGLLKGQG